MSKLAIRGHASRGKEVIELLEMLGGKNYSNHSGSRNDIYFIHDTSEILVDFGCYDSDYSVFTLEEFLERFPYKVGDKVITIDKFIGTITDIRWQGDSFFVGKEEGDIVYTVQVSTNAQTTYQKEDLQPYKEEIIEEELMPKIDFSKYCKNKYLLDMGDYEIKVEDGKTYVVKKRTQYPKTYEECCDILGFKNRNKTVQQFLNSCDLYDSELMIKLSMLKVCRDAYWKIAGEELGLGKPWKPDWTNNYQKKWIINFYQGEINFTTGPNVQFILAFPTVEMRDAFYEKFEDLIETCKELL